MTQAEFLLKLETHWERTLSSDQRQDYNRTLPVIRAPQSWMPCLIAC